MLGVSRLSGRGKEIRQIQAFVLCTDGPSPVLMPFSTLPEHRDRSEHGPRHRGLTAATRSLLSHAEQPEFIILV